MKFWKNWPPALPAGRYWVKGGIIILIIPVLIGIADFIISCNWGRGQEFCGIFSMIASLPVMAITIGEFSPFSFDIKDGGLGMAIWLILYLVTYFLIGAFLGWLYGKISSRGGSAFGGKNRKTDSSPTL